MITGVICANSVMSGDGGVGTKDDMDIDDLPTSQEALQDKLHHVQQQIIR